MTFRNGYNHVARRLHGIAAHAAIRRRWAYAWNGSPPAVVRVATWCAVRSFCRLTMTPFNNVLSPATFAVTARGEHRRQCELRHRPSPTATPRPARRSRAPATRLSASLPASGCGAPTSNPVPLRPLAITANCNVTAQFAAIAVLAAAQNIPTLAGLEPDVCWVVLMLGALVLRLKRAVGR
jgi:hypothetical protein